MDGWMGARQRPGTTSKPVPRAGPPPVSDASATGGPGTHAEEREAEAGAWVLVAAICLLASEEGGPSSGAASWEEETWAKLWQQCSIRAAQLCGVQASRPLLCTLAWLVGTNE